VVGKLVFCWFFEIKLGNGLSRDRIRWEKMQKDRKRYEKIAKDGKRSESTAALLKNTGFPVLQTCTYSLTADSPTNVFIQKYACTHFT